MNAAHTPGPWHFESTQHGDEIDAIIVRDEYHLVIAGVEPHHSSVADPIANARLIAAAPNLLAQLRSITDVAESLHATQSIIDAARAAIAKATAAMTAPEPKG